MHPRSLHHGRYPILELLKESPSLGPYVKLNPAGDQTIDFDNSAAVMALNAALLKYFYKIKDWRIPSSFLCPPIPGRADYIHHLADLFKSHEKLKGLDIGVGANAIYPLIGQRSYGWSFVGSDVNPEAIAAAQENIDQNGLQKSIELRLQKNIQHIFKGVILENEIFDFTMCNPPFHASAKEAEAGSARKKKNLGLKTSGLNFGGQSKELWCEGGERQFVLNMITESKEYRSQVKWFTTLVSKEANLPVFQKALDACETKIIEMSQGQKKSRILAWRF